MSTNSSKSSRISIPETFSGLLFFCLCNFFIQYFYYTINFSSLTANLGKPTDGFDLLIFQTHIFSLLMLVCATFTVGCAITLRFRGRIGWAVFLPLALLETFVFFLIIMDTLVYQTLAVHLHSEFVQKSLENFAFLHEVQLSGNNYATLALYIVLVFAAQGGLALISARAERLTHLSKRTNFAIVAALVLGYALCHQATFRLSRMLAKEERLIVDVLPLFAKLHGRFITQQPLALTYPDAGKFKVKFKNKKNVLYILAESFRDDLVSPELTPSIVKFTREHQCVHSRHHFTNGNTTQYGVFSFLYGVNSYHYPSFVTEQLTSFPIQLLRGDGYSSYGFTASQITKWADSKFLTGSFDSFEEFVDGGLNYANDAKMLARIKEQKAKGQFKDPFLFTFLVSTHHPYTYPKEFEKFTPVLPEDHNHFRGRGLDSSERERVFNRYKNAAMYVDHLFAELIGMFKKEIDSGELVVVFTGDHGEEFWETGGFGHAAPTFSSYRVQVPLVLCAKGLPQNEIELSSHVDIFPTLIDFLQADPAVPELTYSDGKSLLKADNKDRYVSISSSGFPFTSDRVSFITKSRRYWLEKSGRKLTDLRLTKLEEFPSGVLLDSKEKNDATDKDLQVLSARLLKYLKEK